MHVFPTHDIKNIIKLSTRKEFFNMSNFLKTKFKNFSISRRFNKKRAKTTQIERKNEERLKKALLHPEETKSYRNALRTIAIRQTGANIKVFSKWLISDLLWLLPPYFVYGWFQEVLNRTLLAEKISSKTLWGIQEQLMLGAIIIGALVIICGEQIIKNGLFHRPYKKGSLEKQMTASLNRDNANQKINKKS